MNWQSWGGRIKKWGNFGLGPIPTRQYSAALFALSGHILFGLLLTFALVPPKPERVVPPASKTIRVQLNPANKVKATEAASPPIAMAPTTASESASESASEPGSKPADAHTTPAVIPIPTTSAAATAAAAEPANPAATTMTGASKPANPATTASVSSANESQAEVAYYYPSRQLHQKPQVIEDIESNLSLTLPGIETQNVILRLFINELGGIDHIDIEQSSLDADIVAAVTGAFGKLRFTPGKIDGVAVKSQLKIEVLLENALPVNNGKGN